MNRYRKTSRSTACWLSRPTFLTCRMWARLKLRLSKIPWLERGNWVERRRRRVPPAAGRAGACVSASRKRVAAVCCTRELNQLATNDPTWSPTIPHKHTRNHCRLLHLHVPTKISTCWTILNNSSHSKWCTFFSEKNGITILLYVSCCYYQRNTLRLMA